MVRINPLAHFLNHYKIATSKKRLHFDVRVTPRSRQLLELFYYLNLVRRYAVRPDSMIRVYPNYSNHYRYRRNFQSYLRSDHYLTISLNVLRVIDRNLPASYLVLETDRGILLHKTALQKNLGGRLIMRI